MYGAYLVCVVRPNGGDARRDVRLVLGRLGISSTRSTVSHHDVCLAIANPGPRGALREYPNSCRMSVATGDGLPVDPALGLGWVGDAFGTAFVEIVGYSRRFVVAGWVDSSRELLVARDPLGMEPVFYALLPGGGIAVCSSALALLALDDVPVEPDSETCVETLLGLSRRNGATFLKHIAELPRATVLRMGAGGLSVRRYCELRHLRAPEGEPNRPAQMAVGLERSVHKSVHGASRVAVTLSGGLDSTSVFRTAHAVLNGRITPISAVFPSEPQSWESEYLNEAVGGTGCEPVRFEPTDETRLGASLQAADDPLWVPTSSITLACAKVAQDSGFDRVLTGEFGDFVGGGLENPVAWQIQQGSLRRAWAIAAEVGETPWLLPFRFLLQAAKNRYPAVSLLRLQRTPRYRNDLVWLNALAPRIRSQFNLGERLRQDWLASSNPRTTFAERTERFFDRAIERTCGASWLSERMTGVVLEHPFADPGLASLACNLEFSDRWSDGSSRATLRRAMLGRIPDIIRTRTTKARFGGVHRAHYERIRLSGPETPALWPLSELLDLKEPSKGSIPSDAWDAFVYTSARARSVAAWLRMVTRDRASNG